MLRLTKHFIENWEKRVGGKPTEDQVQKLLRESLIVQSGGSYVKPNGKPHRILRTYWHTELDVIIKVDEFSGNVVTVMSKETEGNPINGR